jgi:Asp/Glu/hydantoin racemase
MPKTLALLHTTPLTVPAFKELCAEHLAGTRIINLLDDSLLTDVIATGHVTEAVERRLRAYVKQAETAGACAVLSCCSSIGEVMDRIAAESCFPVWHIDEAMAEEAARHGKRIGVIATVATTLGPTARLVERKAPGATVETVLVESAFDALLAGDPVRHDKLVLEALTSLIERSEVVVLAQASMARLLANLKTQPKIPVLSSPILGLQRAAQNLEAIECPLH